MKSTQYEDLLTEIDLALVLDQELGDDSSRVNLAVTGRFASSWKACSERCAQ